MIHKLYRTGFICIIYATLAGCATVKEVPKVTTVEIPIPVPCAHDAPKPDLKSDDDFKVMDDYNFVIELWIDRQKRQGYEAELEAILEACK